MSKIGNKPVVVSGTTVTYDKKKSQVTVKGPKGELHVDLPKVISVEITPTEVIVKRANETGDVKALHGLFRSLIANAVVGVTKGWEKKVEVVGTGFGVSLKGGDAIFKVGYSHMVTFHKREGLTYTIDGSTILIISGADKQLVGQAAFLARKIKPPDPYKGKGVRYLGEVVKLKPGKKAKTA